MVGVMDHVKKQIRQISIKVVFWKSRAPVASEKKWLLGRGRLSGY